MTMWDEATKKRLIANWGMKADCLECKAEVRVYDPLSRWELYIFAQDPWEEDLILCLGEHYNDCIMLLDTGTLSRMYNSAGEPPQVDTEYRPRDVKEIIKQWRNKNGP